MDDRRQRLLALIVEVFIAQNRPVASRDLAETLGVSSATVRSELALLAEMGLLHQPHTSAGRVPTRDAFRAYAHRFIPPRPLEAGTRERLEDTLSRTHGENRLKLAAQLAAHLSGYAAVTVAAGAEASLEAVFFSSLPDARLVAVLVISGGVTRELVLRPDFKPERATLEKLEQALSKGVLLRDVPAELSRLEQTASPGLAELIRNLREHWNEALPKVSFSSGASPVLTEPESGNVGFLRNLLGILERPANLQSGSFESVNQTPGQVRLDVDDPNGVSTVTVGFRSSALRGQVLIVGPTRMRYPRAISVAKAVSDALGAA